MTLGKTQLLSEVVSSSTTMAAPTCHMTKWSNHTDGYYDVRRWFLNASF